MTTEPFVCLYDLEIALRETLKVRGSLRVLRAYASKEGLGEIIEAAQEALIASDRLYNAIERAQK